MAISEKVELLIKEILDDRTHGASQLARQALETLKVAAEESRAEGVDQFWTEMEEISWRLMSIRPSMAPIYNAVKRLLAAISDDKYQDLDSLRQAAISEADKLIQSSVSAITQIAVHAADLIKSQDIILTHSYSSTVAMALRSAYKKHRIQVIVTRSGVGRTGQRMAWELNYDGIPVTFVDDTAMGLYISQASKVLVGADRICADGGLVNGVGTYLLALAAKEAGVPFYVLCETLKLDFRLKSSEVELEEKEPNEIAQPGILPEGVTVKNPYFDMTPLKLITGIINEHGMVQPPNLMTDLEKLIAQFG